MLEGIALAAALAVSAVIGMMLPAAHRASRSVRLHQTPETVYALIAGPLTWRSDVKQSGTLPDGRWWEENRHGRRVTYELISGETPSKRVIRIGGKSLPFSGVWTIEITPAEGGSILRVTEDGEISNVLLRFFARFVFGYATSIETYLQDAGRAFGETVQSER